MFKRGSSWNPQTVEICEMGDDVTTIYGDFNCFILSDEDIEALKKGKVLYGQTYADESCEFVLKRSDE